MPACRSADLDGTGFHQLRHTTVYWMLRENVNVKKVQWWMRHANIHTTMNTYARFLPHDYDDVADVF